MFPGGESPAIPKISLNGSERHVEVWNQTAAEMGVPIKWVKDVGERHQIDVYAQELEIPAEAREKFGLSNSTPPRLRRTPALALAIADVTRELESKRQQLLGESVKQRKDVVSYVELSHLTDGEVRLLDFHRRTLMPLVDEYQNLHKDRRFPQWERQIQRQARSGDLLSLRQWERRHDDKCNESIGDPRCSPFKHFPNKRAEFDGSPIWTTVPFDVTEADKEALKKAWDGDPKRNPFFSTFTVVEKDGKGGFKWTPESLHPLTRGIVRRLSKAFEQASRIKGIAPSLSQQHLAWAKALQSKEAYPFDEAERATVWQDEGNLEVTVDVSPSYTTFGKNTFTTAVGIVRAGEDQFARQNLRPVLQVAEDKLGKLIPDSYQSRKLNEKVPVRFVDWVLKDVNTHQLLGGEVLAFAFPSGTKISDDEGVAKRVVLVNHQVLKFEHIYIPLSAVALDPEQVPFITQRAVEMFNMLHELSHGIGPQAGSKTKKGGTVDQDLGELNHKLEEAKADTGGLAQVPYLVSKGILSPELAKEMALTWVVGLIRQMRFGGKMHGGAAAMSFGYLCGKGAIEVVEVNVAPKDAKEPKMEKRFRINPEKVIGAAEPLWADIAKIQMGGDPEQAKKYMAEKSKQAPDFLDELTTRFATLGIPRDIKIHYRTVRTKK